MPQIADDHPAAAGPVTFNSGFFWAIETASGEPFNDDQVWALASAFRGIGPPHARLMDQPFLALAFAQIADFFRRTWRDLLAADVCLLPLPPLALPSGALGYAYLAAWPALRTELERQRVWATGPVLDARATPPTPRSGRGAAPVLRCRLVFDPARVGPIGGQTWVERPDPGMLTLGHFASTGVSMAGIDYFASQGSTIAAWSASLADPAAARNIGGQPPIWVAHRDRQPLPRGFAATVVRALDTAAQDTRVRDAAAVRADLQLMVSRTAAVVRLGRTASASLHDATYVRFVRQLTEALKDGGVSAAAVLEPRYVSARPWDEVAQDAAVYIVSPDADLSATRLVHVEQALAEPRPAGDTMEAERQRLSAAVWGSRRPLVVSWLPEPESPLFGHTPPPVRSADIQIYVTAAARLPLTVSRHARAWLELVINGGPSGLDRALREIDQTQRLGAVALAGALAAHALKRPLPVRRRGALDTFRLRCIQQVAAAAERVVSSAELAGAVTDMLLAAVREPTVATNMLAAADALLVGAGTRPPYVLVLGDTRPVLLPADSPDPIWVGLAMAYVAAGYEQDLEAVWDGTPMDLLPPQSVDAAVPEWLDPVASETDGPALRAYARWALQDAAARRTRGVRGATAYVAVLEPRLRRADFARAYFLRETDTHVLVLCRSAGGARVIVRLPRSGEHWDPWAATPGGALLAAYLAGAYRDMVVPLEMVPFAEEERAPESGTAPTRRLEPVGYLPMRQRPPQRGGGGLVQRLRPAPHPVTWYVRRLVPGQRATPRALARAAAIGVVVPAGYTFVDSYHWPRSLTSSNAPTALRATLALSSLRTLLAHTSATESPASDQPTAQEPPHKPPSDEAASPQLVTSAQQRRPWWAFWRRP